MKIFSSALAAGIALSLPTMALPAAAGTHVRTSPGVASQRAAEAYLGIGFRDVGPDEAAALHWKSPHGAEVVVVDHDGPAGQAGLRPRDIITAVNGQVIESAASLKRMLHDAGANVRVALEVMRGNQRTTLTAQLTSREAVERSAQEKLMSPLPAPPDVAQSFVAGGVIVEDSPDLPAPDAPGRSRSFLGSILHGAPFTGLTVEETSPQLRSYFGAPQGGGLLVTEVVAGSPASQAGLHAGDVLVRADGTSLRTLGDWGRRLKSSHGHGIVVGVVRERREQTVVLTPDLKRRSAVDSRTLCPPPACLRSSETWG